MANENDIAALEAALATVEEGIRQVEALLATPANAGDAGLKATLADLQGQRAAIRFRLANLRAAAVVVAGAPTRGPMGAAPTRAGAAPAEKVRTRATLTFARRASALAKATLKAAGGGPRPVKKR